MDNLDMLTPEEVSSLTPDRQWEYGVDINGHDSKRHDAYISYDKEAVKLYRAESAQSLVDNPKQLLTLIRHHKMHQVPRLEALEAYYLGNNPMIMSGQRRLEKNKSDHRIRHGWASIISDFLNSYVLSNPVKIYENGEESKDLKEILEMIYSFNQSNDIDSHNIEIGKDQNNFGRAYELLQRTEDDTDKIYRLDPTTVFMIYDQTVRSRVIAACRYFPIEDYSGKQQKWQIELYTHDEIITYQSNDPSSARKITEIDSSEHMFGGVPIVEYRSDRYRMCVFEKQLSQIDAYDAAQSDTANYMTDFNDAILAIKGRIYNADDANYMAKMKDANMIILTPEASLNGAEGGVEAGYLVKSYDVQGVEAYKTRLKQDLFNTASTPDLSDNSFAGQQSGQALKYKMFGLQQKRSDKEKYFGKGLRVRYKLLENLKRVVHEFTGETAELVFSFTPNLPKAYLEELKAFVDSGGKVSEETMLGLLSFVDDVKAEIQRIKAEEMPIQNSFEAFNRLGDDHGQETTGLSQEERS